MSHWHFTHLSLLHIFAATTTVTMTTSTSTATATTTTTCGFCLIGQFLWN